MSHKVLVKIAIVMVIVFGATVLLYPMLFNPDNKNTESVAAPPVTFSAPVQK